MQFHSGLALEPRSALESHADACPLRRVPQSPVIPIKMKKKLNPTETIKDEHQQHIYGFAVRLHI